MTTAKLDPNRTALLVMDYQNGITGMIADADALVARTAETLARFRQAGATIGYVRVGFADGETPGGAMGRRLDPEQLKMFHADAPATQVVDALAPQAGDIVVRKTRVGAFSTTDLHQQLQAKGIDTLMLAGISTSGVTLTTIREAADRDYRVIVAADLCADPDAEVHEFLMTKIYPRQGEVVNATELATLIQA